MAAGMDQYLGGNRELWNELTPIHQRSRHYDLEGFESGKLTLTSIELEELGEVSGKSLLHLMCHFGLDTLSWARLGARVTGVDFSDRAVALARSLSQELGIGANFVVANVYDLRRTLSERFDLVFTSYGVLCWLPDLARWAQVVAHFLKPGGTFYMVEFHPFASVFYNGHDATELKVHYPYFHNAEPMRFEPEGSYADRSARVSSPSYEWSHSLGDVLNSLIAAGLRVQFMHEFDRCVYQRFPFMERDRDGWWRLRDRGDSIPLMFSVKATK